LIYKLNERKISLTITNCSHTDEAASIYDPIETDLVILDITWDYIYMSSSTLIKKIRDKAPLLKMIGVTKNCNKNIIPRLKQLNIQGYFCWDTESLTPILDCIEKVVKGERHYCS
jgi:DNA-binding NarL/FixJ family response regulator